MKNQLKITVALTVTTIFLISIACKKKEDKPEETPATTTSTSTTTTGSNPVIADGFTITTNINETIVADSSYCKPTNSIHNVRSYKAGYPNFDIRLNANTLVAKTYPLDSINLGNSGFFPGIQSYDLNSGSISITNLTATKATGTFTFGVTALAGANATRTLITGTFKNINVK